MVDLGQSIEIMRLVKSLKKEDVDLISALLMLCRDHAKTIAFLQSSTFGTSELVDRYQKDATDLAIILDDRDRDKATELTAELILDLVMIGLDDRTFVTQLVRAFDVCIQHRRAEVQKGQRREKHNAGEALRQNESRLPDRGE